MKRVDIQGTAKSPTPDFATLRLALPIKGREGAMARFFAANG